MTIAWQTRSALLFDSIEEGKLALKANGGNAYDFEAAMALRSSFELNADRASVYTATDNPLSYWLRMRNHLPKAEVRIMEPYPIVFGGKFGSTRNIAMIHHIDEQAHNGGLKHKWFYSRLFKRLKDFDTVVTVSKFWQQYFLDMGCKDVRVIYNSFEPSDYRFDEQTIDDFKSSKGFATDRPLVYIGNASAGKGVREVYNALKESNYQLVMTGGTNRASDIPVTFLSLSALEYRKLIASCTVVLAMSNMMEGWNRVAHEAMLCGVPVIGSGSGGMRELLEGGNQHIASGYHSLPALMETAINNRSELTRNGLAYVSQFDKRYFQHAWRAIIQ